MFIGREEIIEQIRRHDHGTPLVADIRGGLGTGRTWLLHHLGREPQLGLRTIFVDLEDFNPDHPGQVGDKASVGAVQASFNEYAKLLELLVERAAESSAAGEQMRRSVQRVRNDEVRAGRVMSLSSSLHELETPLEPRKLADAWRHAAEALTRTFVDLWQAHADGCLLLLDNFDSVADQEMGTWITGLLRRRDEADGADGAPGPLARPIVVITRSAAEPEPGWKGAIQATWQMSNLTRAEVETFVRGYRGVAVDSATVERVHEVTEGHPATLRLVCELLWGRALAAPGSSPEELLHDLPDDPAEKPAALVERLVARLATPGLMEAIEAAAVPRRFDAELLSALLGEDARDQFEAIRKLPFTETSLRLGGLRIHEFLRASILARMEVLQRSRLRELHERAQDYYELRLHKDVRDGRDHVQGYGSWYFLESSVWQDRKREWLYHLARVADPGKRQGALLEATTLFLDATWWWGNYVHFDFCDRLVADLGHLVRDLSLDGPGTASRLRGGADAEDWPELRILHRALEQFLADYPLRSQKSPEADWPTVRSTLLKIQHSCGLAHLPRRAGAPQRHVFALLNVFLAHTWRYQARGEGADAATHQRRADEAYLRAAAAFEQNADAWNGAWVAFERADLRVEHLKHDHPGADDGLAEVRRLVGEAAAYVQPTQEPLDDATVDVEAEDEPPDHELMSNLHRLRGDVQRLQGLAREAATSYGRAVLHAYLFHLVEGPPDEYTLQFYVDIRARALEFLDWVRQEAGQDEAVACARVVRDEALRSDIDVAPLDETRLASLLPAIRREAAIPLALLLFPRGPEIEELDDPESPFTEEHQEFTMGLDPSVESDLHDEPRGFTDA